MRLFLAALLLLSCALAAHALVLPTSTHRLAAKDHAEMQVLPSLPSELPVAVPMLDCKKGGPAPSVNDGRGYPMACCPCGPYNTAEYTKCCPCQYPNYFY